jgi:hypothetical protein
LSDDQLADLVRKNQNILKLSKTGDL